MVWNSERESHSRGPLCGAIVQDVGPMRTRRDHLGFHGVAVGVTYPLNLNMKDAAAAQTLNAKRTIACLSHEK